MGSVAPYVVSFFLRLIYGVTNILTKIAFSQGTSACVLVFYRFLIASVLLLPLAVAFERKTAPPLSFKVSLKLFVHALYGKLNEVLYPTWPSFVVIQSLPLTTANIFIDTPVSQCISMPTIAHRQANSYVKMTASTIISYIGLDYVSATSASAVINLVPVLTFFLAVLFRMESLNLKRSHGVVKVSGLVLCSVGVTVLALYQGPELKSFIHHRLFHHASHGGTNSARKWILGVILQSLAAAMWALCAVLQGHLFGEYPSKLLNTTLQIAFATVQSFLMAFLIERDFSRWKLSLDGGLVAIIYCGITLAVLCYLQVWLVDMRGPVFLSMTVPLTLVFTINLTVIGEAVTLGSVISGALLVGGLYNVLWGKRIEQVPMSSQGDDGGNAALDLEEQGSAASVLKTQD